MAKDVLDDLVMQAQSEGIAERAGFDAAQTLIVMTLFGLLIDKGVLHQGEVISALEQLSIDLMKKTESTGIGTAVQHVDAVRDFFAQEDWRKPS